MNHRLSWLGLVVLFLLVSPVAFAHSGHSHESGLSDGALHPLTGVDHILAMITVGLWASQLGGRAQWLLPLTFVGLMFGGGLLASVGMELPAVEHGIAASVLILGLAVACAARPPMWLVMTLVGLFAIFHGHAHMTEMSSRHSVAAYALGFVISTIALHAVGLVLGIGARRLASTNVIRITGGAIAACGLMIFVGVL